ncbi:hypothetical protein LX16_3828 [Stackebrandtia albiflava]|uniref:Uncharacterized protein n=1 Tax=Stackebrandtia albiflava TaxID=406432 RepID=A0A562V5B5_9ACTN|nr:hypothetical protein [Stackebrandtia albiflava]TWJ13060.1 hypothetical protein LX16_3828 [Stackebrandtia albiflava]
MRRTASRGSRAKRRHVARPRADVPPTPEGWPDGDVLKDRLEINSLAATLLEEMEPDTVRTLLKRMDTPARKAVFEPHNIPVTKVSLRAADQVLALLRSDDTPAESPILGAMLNPAAELFHHAAFESGQVTGLRLKLVDLALPLIVTNDQVVAGLRTWHRWAEDSFEDLTLSVVIGLKCSHAALAAAYLSASHPDIAERYTALCAEYPALPPVAIGRLTTTNPLTRYLAGRPDRRIPGTPAELRMMLRDDSRVRQAELEQAQRERARTPDDDAPPLPAEPEVSSAPEPSEPPAGPPLEDGPALPGVQDWANAVIASRRITERLIAGEAPDPVDLLPLRVLQEQMTPMAELLTLVLGRQVAPTREAVDSALALALSEPEAARHLGEVPGTRAEVARRLAALRTDPPQSGAGAPEDTVTPAVPESDDADLADLDGVLRGEAGARLASLAGPAASPPRQRIAEVDAPVAAGAPADAGSGEPPVPDVPDPVRELVALALQIRVPQGAVAERFQRVSAELEPDVAADPVSRMLIVSAAMPVSLVDPAAGGVPWLSEPPGALSAYPRVLALRDAIAELCRQGVQPRDPALIRLADLTSRLHHTSLSAQELLSSAETRTLKFDKATKVYRHWMAPGGVLRPLVDALAQNGPIEQVEALTEECRKLGAGRAIDDTAAELMDANRTRIVAGARKTLTDKFTEVLDLADVAVAIAADIRGERHADRTAVWRFDALTRFRERTDKALPDIEAELAGATGPYRLAAAAVCRALSLAVSPDPLYGPEPAPASVFPPGAAPGDGGTS